jgi:hypothetical protein
LVAERRADITLTRADITITGLLEKAGRWN